MNYTEKLKSAIRHNESTLCVGLDPVYTKLPQTVIHNSNDESEAIKNFCKRVIDVTSDYCCAYKPNLAFFEALGPPAFEILEQVCSYIPSDKIIIADAKRGDISSTAEHYCKTFFEWLDADALTLNPLMGFDSLEPFLGYNDKALYVLTLTSNKGASDFFLKPFGDYSNMSMYIAKNLRKLAEESDTHPGMVVGATKSSMIGDIVDTYPGGALLLPGLGKQGGQVDELLSVLDQSAALPLVNASRSIIYSFSDEKPWDRGVNDAAQSYHKELKPLTDQYV